MKLIRKDGSRLFVTSLDISNRFGKEHKVVLRAIENTECTQGFRRRNFALSSYNNSQNKPQPMYEITRDGFVFLCMGFTGQQAALWKERYIDAFNAMETTLREQPGELPQLRSENRALARKVSGLSRLLAAQCPEWAAAWRYRELGLSYREVGRLLGKSEDSVYRLYRRMRDAGLELAPLKKPLPRLDVQFAPSVNAVEATHERR